MSCHSEVTLSLISSVSINTDFGKDVVIRVTRTFFIMLNMQYVNIYLVLISFIIMYLFHMFYE